MLQLPDVNVLLYAVNSGAPQFAVAQAALARAYEKGAVARWCQMNSWHRLPSNTGPPC